jgi:hypothetical protein
MAGDTVLSGDAIRTSEHPVNTTSIAITVSAQAARPAGRNNWKAVGRLDDAARRPGQANGAAERRSGEAISELGLVDRYRPGAHVQASAGSIAAVAAIAAIAAIATVAAIAACTAVTPSATWRTRAAVTSIVIGGEVERACGRVEVCDAVAAPTAFESDAALAALAALATRASTRLVASDDALVQRYGAPAHIEAATISVPAKAAVPSVATQTAVGALATIAVVATVAAVAAPDA